MNYLVFLIFFPIAISLFFFQEARGDKEHPEPHHMNSTHSYHSTTHHTLPVYATKASGIHKNKSSRQLLNWQDWLAERNFLTNFAPPPDLRRGGRSRRDYTRRCRCNRVCLSRNIFGN